MKKIMFSFVAFSLLASVSFADCACSKATTAPQNPCSKNIECEKTLPPTCEENKCNIEDDEYCTYNECFFDKKFKNMKKALCLTQNQECIIDGLYKDFKADMENYHAKYRTIKNEILEAIECNECYSENVETLKDLKKDVKERCKCFKKDVKNQLCKDQYSDYRKYQREQKKKMKKIAKYGKIYKLPCVNCCK